MVNIDQDEGQENQDRRSSKKGIDTEHQHGPSSRFDSTRSIRKNQGPKASGTNRNGGGGVILLLDASFERLIFSQLQVVLCIYLSVFSCSCIHLHFIQYEVDDFSYVFLIRDRH